MNSFLIFTLVAHIILGLIAIAALYAVWMGLLKKRLAARFLAWSAWISAISFFLSWLSGGYYYVVHYGKAVKPLIKAGPYPWAHTVVMEAKEHIFLFLPFCALVVTTNCLFQSLGSTRRCALTTRCLSRSTSKVFPLLLTT